MADERRNFSRVEFKANVSIRIDGQIQDAELVDISLKGALVRIREKSGIAKGKPCLFTFRLDQTDTILNFESTVVYEKETSLGLKFDHIDLDSMIHLRRLVELNVGNPDQIQQELFFLVNIS